MQGRRSLAGLLAALATLSVSNVRAADWPTYRHDISRSGVTSEQLPVPLTRAWTHHAPFAPVPAFGTGFPHVTNWEGGVEKRRIDFDRADSVVAAGGNAYFGSVGDGRVYCLDAATAAVRWTFPTAGPIRLTPTLHDGRLYVGSDDGWVYCLSAGDGTVIRKFRAAPDNLRVIGHGRLRPMRFSSRHRKITRDLRWSMVSRQASWRSNWRAAPIC